MTKLDLQDAYLTVAIDPLLQKLIRFIWKDKVHQFQALPFGLNVAPRVFAKLLKPVAAFFRRYVNKWLQVPGNSVVHSTSYQPSHCFGHQRPQREVNNNSNSGNHLPRVYLINSNSMMLSLPPEKRELDVYFANKFLRQKVYFSAR